MMVYIAFAPPWLLAGSGRLRSDGKRTFAPLWLPAGLGSKSRAAQMVYEVFAPLRLPMGFGSEFRAAPI